MKSWKTTAAGVIAALGVLLGLVGSCLSGDCDWNAIVTQFMVVLGFFGVGLFARDKDVSSQQEGIR